MDTPDKPHDLVGMQIIYTDNGSLGHIESIRDDGLPIIRFFGCRSPRVCLWSEIKPNV